MEEIIRAVSENPLVALAVGVSAALLIYLLFKSLIKLVLILILVAIVIYGYSYLRHPESRPADFRKAVEDVRVGAGKAVEQGKDAYRKSRELVETGRSVYEKGRELVDRGKEVLDRGMETGKEAAVEEEGAGDRGKIPGGERTPGKRQNL